MTDARTPNKKPCPCCKAEVDVFEVLGTEECPECGESLEELMAAAGEEPSDVRDAEARWSA